MKKFTLIELLVVVAIIGILATLLLPRLKRARKAAELAVCLSNVKQMGFASYQYAQKNNAKMPFPNWSSQEGPHGWDGPGWLYDYRVGKNQAEHVEYGALWPFLKSRDIYRCPGDTGDTQDMLHRPGTNKITSYNVNGSLTAFGNPNSFIGTFHSYSLSRLPNNGVYMFCKDKTGNWNDGANWPTEIGRYWNPETGLIRYADRMPSQHSENRKRTNVSFLDGSAKTVSGMQWENWIIYDRPGQLYYNPGSRFGGG